MAIGVGRAICRRMSRRNDAGVAKRAKDVVGGHSGAIVARVEFDRIGIDVRLEPEQLNVTMHRAVGLLDG